MGKNVKGSGQGLTEVLFWNLPEETQKAQEKSELG
jgi:hypothetical protein